MKLSEIVTELEALAVLAISVWQHLKDLSVPENKETRDLVRRLIRVLADAQSGFSMANSLDNWLNGRTYTLSAETIRAIAQAVQHVLGMAAHPPLGDFVFMTTDWILTQCTTNESEM